MVSQAGQIYETTYIYAPLRNGEPSGAEYFLILKNRRDKSRDLMIMRSSSVTWQKKIPLQMA
jgi:hypothetical protein